MLVIRLRRVGKKNKPTYRVVLAEHSYPVNGKFTADLGFYNPHSKSIGLKIEEIKLWLSKGAKPSNTVARLLLNEKVKHASIVFEKRNRKPKNEKTEKPAAAAPAESATEEAPEASTTEPATEKPTDAPAGEAN